MESEVVRTERRGRKRRRKVAQGASVDQQPQKKQTRSRVFVGRYVKKEFEGSGVFLGKIVSYDRGLYRVDYEDGDCEDLKSGEVKFFVIEEDDLDDAFLLRKKNLDESVSKKYAKAGNAVESAHVTDRVESVNSGGKLGNAIDYADVSNRVERLSSGGMLGNAVELANVADRFESFSRGGAPEAEGTGAQVEADSSSDSCEYARDRNLGLEVDTPSIPPPQLPPSSGNIGVPEEYVSCLFSVYSFLRSFSIRLFLSPFGLDEFVGALNCSIPNTLSDAIHVSLMCALSGHFEMLSLDGSEFASRRLRSMDWSLLDTLTWPVFLVQYLMVMRYTEGPEWKGFYVDALDRDYYTLSAGRKLMILQILCDDVLDSAELRAEVDMREESEVGSDSDVVKVIAPESGPRRVHPRYSKTSACKDQEAREVISDSHMTKLPSLVSGADVDEDGNGDECRLCGMDGMLLCCDGCPSAYHSRCIGVSKMFIPEGAWYCPECEVNILGPNITRATSLRGAEIFGVDSYEQLFVGTCDHLLVLKVSRSSESCFRYYNQKDIKKVLLSLCSSMDYSAIYSEICKGILQYWEIPEDVLSLGESVELDKKLPTKKEDGECSTQYALLGKESSNVPELVDAENVVSGVTESASEDMVVSCIANICKEPGSNHVALDEVKEFDQRGQQITDHGFCTGNGKHSVDIKVKTSRYAASVSPQPDPSELASVSLQADPSELASVSLQPDPSELTQQSFGEKSSLMESATCTSGNSNPGYRGHVNGVCVAANISSHCKEASCVVNGRGSENSADGSLYMGSSFKPQAYFNLYTHGDFAASAAANLAILSSEENRVSESHASSNHRKLMSANFSLQIRAFSLAAKRFFWPNSDKKLVEVPRERCGWCLSCKAAVTCKRGCLLNAAVSNAIKGAVKILACLRQLKNGEGCLAAIATYVMFMEESLSGLTVGPFLSPTYRKQWRKQLEQAATMSTIKTSLLELEENIRIIAFSADWVKLVDDTAVELSVIESATSVVGLTHKRGPGRRRGRKQSTTSEVTNDDHEAISTGFVWWRGGMLSKHIFQRGILPCSMIKKSARQGGSGKIPGIHYAEVLEVPKRSRQFVWRAAVEMSKNAAQLALQVRYLDLHVRWSDLVRPEQSLQEGKGPETEASAFRNAFVVDKKSMENKISYGVAFENQKHLPSRVLKNILEVEQSEDGKERHWFVETRIPLYLIKEYEKVEKVLLPSANKPVKALSKLQKRQLKASRKDIFSYLSRKRDNMSKCCCASCQLDVLLGNAVKCSACQGYCHEQCIVSSTVHTREEVEFLITCKQCYNEKAVTQNENFNESPTSPLLLQGPVGGKQNGHAVMATKSGKQNGHKQPLTMAIMEPSSEMKSTKDSSLASNRTRKLSSGPLSPVTMEQSSEMKSTKDSSLASNRKHKLSSGPLSTATMEQSSEMKSTKARKLSSGLIWKKKNTDTGIDFRLKNILFKDNPNGNLLAPECHLCGMPYNSSLMYIRCDTCNKWYHAEAVELDESKILELIGFKCCRCRRIRSPVCPYTDPETKKVIEAKKPRTRAPKQTNFGMDPDSDTVYELVKDREPHVTPILATKEEIINVKEENPLLVSLSTVNNQVNERNLELDFECDATAPVSGSVPQKLPVRRHMKSEKEVDSPSGNNPCFESSAPYVENILNPAEESSSPHVEWDVSMNGFEDDIMFDYEGLNYEDMEFEPQTYFSFNELLASDNGVQSDGIDPSRDVMGNWEDSSAPLQDCNPEQYQMGISYDQQEPMFSVEEAAADSVVPCRMCLQTEPCPDLSCQICGLWMHSHCSPWDEESSWEGGWRCGNCREWR